MRIDAPLRNVDVGSAERVEDLPAEAIEILLDRGSFDDWRLLAGEIRRSPYGRVARTVERIASWSEHDGVDALMLRLIDQARDAVDASARRRYADRIASWRRDAGLTLKEAAELAGTSASTLSAYEHARVAPTTAVLGRLEELLGRAATKP